MLEKVMSKWGRYVAPALVVLTLAFAFVATPLRVMADNWVGGFLRDAVGNLDVNCVAGCVAGGTQGNPTYVAGSGTGTYTVVQPTGANMHIVCDSGCGAAPPWNQDDTITDTAVHIIKGSAGTLGFVTSLCSASCTSAAICKWYDNASAASGKILYETPQMGQGQHVPLGGGGGIKAANGITAQCTGASPSGDGIGTGWL